ncbi:MAG: homoserine kinase [Candidatus Bathyarchaeia archaeon]
MSVHVRAPASTSNLGAGYDVFGLALDLMHDEVEVTLSDSSEITITVEGEYKGRVSTDPRENSAGVAAAELLRRAGLEGQGLSIQIRKGIPAGSGLGSSGASSAATVVALDQLLKLNLSKETLVEVAATGETVAAGTPHADNVAPSILGGFTVIYSYNPIRLLTFPPPKRVTFAVAVPQTIVKTTREARSVVPGQVTINDLRFNIGGASMVLAGLLLSNPELIGKGMLRDAVVEPARRKLYPGYEKAREAALALGAYGVTLSGAGPSAIAVAPPKIDHRALAEAMAEAFRAEGVPCRGYATRPAVGAYIQLRRPSGLRTLGVKGLKYNGARP